MIDFAPFGKLLIFFGFLLALIGAFFLIGNKIPFLGKLPGDIFIEKKNFSFYFPIVTCFIISAALSLIFWLLSRR